MIKDCNYIMQYYESNIVFYEYSVYYDTIFLGLHPPAEKILNNAKSFVWFPKHTFLNGLFVNLQSHSYTSQYENLFQTLEKIY